LRVAVDIFCAPVAFCFSQSWYARSLIASLLVAGASCDPLAMFVDGFS
jgi:hypothetical protein